MRRLGKWLVVACIAGLLAVPFVVSLVRGDVRASEGLNGVQLPQEVPRLTCASLLDGTWQEETAAYRAARLPFRADAIRSFDTLDYWLFHHTYMNDGKMLVGRGGWLYETIYPEPYVRDIHSEEELAALFGRLRAVELTLEEKYGKRFLFVISPSKAYTDPEHLPAAYAPFVAGKGMREYGYLVRALEAAQIPFVDGQALALEQKAGGVPAFGLAGTHWNGYTAARTMERVLDRLALPYVPVGLPHESAVKQTQTDDDLLQLANLHRSAWPRVTYLALDLTGAGAPQMARKDVSLALIAGSFGWTLWEYVLQWDPVFSRMDMEYYYHLGHRTAVRRLPGSSPFYDVQEDPAQALGKVEEDEAWKQRLLSHDVVVVECNAQLEVRHIEAFVARAERVL